MEELVKNIVESLNFLVDERFSVLAENRCPNLHVFNKHAFEANKEEYQMASLELTIQYYTSESKPYFQEDSETLLNIMRDNQLGKAIGVKINLKEMKTDFNKIKDGNITIVKL